MANETFCQEETMHRTMLNSRLIPDLAKLVVSFLKEPGTVGFHHWYVYEGLRRCDRCKRAVFEMPNYVSQEVFDRWRALQIKLGRALEIPTNEEISIDDSDICLISKPTDETKSNDAFVRKNVIFNLTTTECSQYVCPWCQLSFMECQACGNKTRFLGCDHYAYLIRSRKIKQKQAQTQDEDHQEETDDDEVSDENDNQPTHEEVKNALKMMHPDLPDKIYHLDHNVMHNLTGEDGGLSMYFSCETCNTIYEITDK